MQHIEHVIERILWNSRLMVLVAVAASIVVAAGALLMGTVDSIGVLYKIISYADPQLSSSTRGDLRADLITGMVKAIDGYLIAAILLIFGLGLYELFVNKIDTAADASSGRLLQIRGLDDLKDRLAKAVLLVLIVEFFQYALQLSFNSALDLLYLAIGILFIAGAIYLTKDKPASKPRAKTRRGPVILSRRHMPPTQRSNGPSPIDRTGDNDSAKGSM